MEKEIKVAKIVATPKLSSWSQAYNAGKLFAVLSLEREDETEEEALSLLGKQTIENLEAEFFTLEDKNMTSIKGAVEKSLQEIPGEVSTSIAVGAIVNNILYVFAKGKGKVSIKREDKLGTILLSGDELSSSSGFLSDLDIVIFQTSQFADIVSDEILKNSLDHQPVEEIAETLAPLIHEKERGASSALILEYKKEVVEEAIPQPIPETIESDKPFSLVFLQKYVTFARDQIKTFRFESLDHSRRLFLTVGLLLVVVFVGSVFIAIKRQADQKTKALYEKYYVVASKKYDEGQSLLELNRNVARDDLTSAQKLLLEGQIKFSKGTREKTQVDDLLNKVNSLLASSANIKTVEAKAVDSEDSKLLSAELSSKADFVTKEDSDIYTLDPSGVSKNGKVIVKKDWTNAAGLGVYFGNVYVLDKTSKQLLKFISTSSEYVKTNYFAKDTTPDVSTAKSIAIDGSIWILLNDGTVLKFTRGKSDNLQLSGLDKGFASPTRIFTNADSDNIYILDNGNSRIVVFDKNGAYQSQYQTSILKDAKDFEVLEKSKKIYILNNNRIYLIDLR